MKLTTLKVLSEAEVKDIHEASIDILGTCGVKILGKKMLQFLKKKGIDVDEETSQCITAQLVAEHMGIDKE